MVVFPVAKINIGLRVTGKRDDGFHNIETIFYPIGLCDALESVSAGEGSAEDTLTVTGHDTEVPSSENLVIKAIKRLRESCSFPYLIIHLHKAIPSGAGLGGGSSDAAFILKLVNKAYGLKLSKDDLKKQALTIGSDCPFFIDSIPALGRGRGEMLTPLASNILSGLRVVLANPKIRISTREVYENCRPAQRGNDLSELARLPVSEWRESITNDFEEYVFGRHPVVAQLKELFYASGALYSSMSGSGSTVYGIFREEPVLPEEIRKFVIYSGYLQ